MKKYAAFLLGLSLSLAFFFAGPLQAKALIEVMPSSTTPLILSPQGSTFVTYTAKNNTSKQLSALSITPNYGSNRGSGLNIYLSSNSCSGQILAPGSSCNFIVSINSSTRLGQSILMPRICAYNGAICSVPLSTDRIRIIVSAALPSHQFPLPYAGSFYPIYNSGPGQWLSPSQPPIPPFDEVSGLFVAFAHAYPQQNGAILNYEQGQVDEPLRLAQLVQAARLANPNIKILISLGWGKDDWTYINTDYVNRANLFVPSVIQFIRSNQLDGFDIDDESINVPPPDSSGMISQENFDGVIANLRNALNEASLQDGKPYYLTITPAGNNENGGLEQTQVDALNAPSFDLINIQSYYNGDPNFGENFFDALLFIGYPPLQIANGIDTEVSCNPAYPPYQGLAGLFNWTMTSDSICNNYENTQTIANLVGY